MKFVKKLFKAIMWLVVILLVVLAAHPLWLGPTVKGVANCTVPGMTKTDFNLSGAGVNLYKGRVELNDMALKNPEGCTTENAVSFKTLRVEVAPTSVLSDTIVVREFYLEGLFASYVDFTDPKDASFKGSNWDWIVKQLDLSGEDKEDLEEAGNTKVLINDFYIKDAKVLISIPLIGMKTPITLPDIRLSIDEAGIHITEPIKMDYSEKDVTIAKVGELIVRLAVKAMSELGVKGLEMLGDLGGAAINFAGDLGGKAMDAVSGIVGNVDASAALDGAKDMGNKVMESAGDMGAKAMESAGDMGAKAMDAAGDMGGKVMDAAGDMGAKTMDTVKGFIPFGK